MNCVYFAIWFKKLSKSNTKCDCRVSYHHTPYQIMPVTVERKKWFCRQNFHLISWLQPNRELSFHLPTRPISPSLHSFHCTARPLCGCPAKYCGNVGPAEFVGPCCSQTVLTSLCMALTYFRIHATSSRPALQLLPSQHETNCTSSVKLASSPDHQSVPSADVQVTASAAWCQARARTAAAWRRPSPSTARLRTHARCPASVDAGVRSACILPERFDPGDFAATQDTAHCKIHHTNLHRNTFWQCWQAYSQHDSVSNLLSFLSSLLCLLVH